MKHFDPETLNQALVYANELSTRTTDESKELFDTMKYNDEAQALAGFIFTGAKEDEQRDYALGMFGHIFQAGRMYEQLRRQEQPAMAAPTSSQVVSTPSRRHLWQIGAVAMIAAVLVGFVILMVDRSPARMMTAAALLTLFGGAIFLLSSWLLKNTEAARAPERSTEPSR